MRERIVGNASLLFGQSDYDRHKASFGITVHEDYQNVGLGSYLTSFMIRVSRAKGLKKIVLEVVSHIERVIKVYERNGFKKEGLLVKNHWNYILERYCDDFVMGLLL